MSKTRLLASDRKAIRNAVVAHKFGPMFDALKTEGQHLAAEAYERLYDKNTRRAMSRLPDGAFHDVGGMSVNCAGQRHHLTLSAPRMVFAKHHYQSTILTLEATDDLCERIREWASREDCVRTSRGALRQQTDATLSAFRTFDDLAVAWPEADTFIKARWQTRPDYTANVPAVVLKDLSAALDLPPEEIAEAA